MKGPATERGTETAIGIGSVIRGTGTEIVTRGRRTVRVTETGRGRTGCETGRGSETGRRSGSEGGSVRLIESGAGAHHGTGREGTAASVRTPASVGNRSPTLEGDEDIIFVVFQAGIVGLSCFSPSFFLP